MTPSRPKRFTKTSTRGFSLISPRYERCLLRNCRRTRRYVTMQHQHRLDELVITAQPAESPAGHAHRLRQPANHDRSIAKRRQRSRSFARVVKLAIDLVADQIGAVIAYRIRD